MSTFRRFCARRGACAHVYSNNGTNLVGAANELREIYEFLKKEEPNLATELAARNIQWHFIPPLPIPAPHILAVYEKQHQKVSKNNNEESAIHIRRILYLLVEIEGILNSRPLTALSSDQNDLQPLTPAHFLIGDSLQKIPEL